MYVSPPPLHTPQTNTQPTTHPPTPPQPKERFHLPPDLEASHTYGPLSGRSYEERALAAYRHGLLQAK
jgi:hypothetical protein